jgi:hypothetical protein
MQVKNAFFRPKIKFSKSWKNSVFGTFDRFRPHHISKIFFSFERVFNLPSINTKKSGWKGGARPLQSAECGQFHTFFEQITLAAFRQLIATLASFVSFSKLIHRSTGNWKAKKWTPTQVRTVSVEVEYAVFRPQNKFCFGSENAAFSTFDPFLE